MHPIFWTLFLSGSQTNPCFWNYNSGCRLTAQINEKSDQNFDRNSWRILWSSGFFWQEFWTNFDKILSTDLFCRQRQFQWNSAKNSCRKSSWLCVVKQIKFRFTPYYASKNEDVLHNTERFEHKLWMLICMKISNAASKRLWPNCETVLFYLIACICLQLRVKMRAFFQ